MHSYETHVISPRQASSEDVVRRWRKPKAAGLEASGLSREKGGCCRLETETHSNLPEDLLLSYSDIRYEINDGIAELTLARDDRRNTLTDSRIIDEIVDALDRAVNDQAGVLILTGEGKAFSAGGNIKEARKRAESDAPASLRSFYTDGIHRIVKAVWGLEIPTIAAVNGPAIGAGFDLVLYCDLAIASTDARFCEQFVNIGLIPGDGGAWILPRRLGWQVAADLAFTGRTVGAEEARLLGIVRDVVTPDVLMPRTRDLAAQIASRPPLAVRYIKMLLRQGGEQGLDEHLSHCAALQALCQKSEDHAAALAAFMQRSPITPTFTGR